MIIFFRLFCISACVQFLTLTSFAQNTSKGQFGNYPLSQLTLKSLETGSILVEIKKNHDPQYGKSVDIHALMIVGASDEIIWPILTNCDLAPSITPGLIKCEILEKAQDGSWDIRRHTSRIGFGLPNVISEFRSEFSPPSQQKFARTGGDLKALNGQWDIISTPDKSRTLIAYQARISSKSILPDYILRRSLRKRIPIVMKSLRKKIITDTESQD